MHGNYRYDARTNSWRLRPQLHPCLVLSDELSGADKEKDRNQVRS